ncbi:MAG TPA: BCAM0308 family protein [Aromatoleum sp.]|uniref:BCAM0308 family protein n=1 Tax=Aromatoleum sp. TaxID=2307007 RepID=UPI002B49446F|nr:BCAM0308 family protein [Aromatoleum sp.]HJV26758.1 BCAM0308 family protein [Aromatoleum sp.]
MSHHAKATSSHPVRHDRLIQEHRHDPYADRGKPAEPAACPDCGAVFHGGRWRQAVAPVGAHAQLCPACRRMRDKFPAGVVMIGGDFTAAEKDEYLRLIEHEAEAETREHAVERIMDIEQDDGTLIVTTTGVHLARRIGEALQHAHRGLLELKYSDSECFVRVYFWH